MGYEKSGKEEVTGNVLAPLLRPFGNDRIGFVVLSRIA